MHMEGQALKKFPSFKTDQEAEDFVNNADLSEYDFSDFHTVKYEFEPKNATISLRLPENLLAEVKAKAAEKGLSCNRFIRLTLEKAV